MALRIYPSALPERNNHGRNGEGGSSRVALLYILQRWNHLHCSFPNESDRYRQRKQLPHRSKHAAAMRGKVLTAPVSSQTPSDPARQSPSPLSAPSCRTDSPSQSPGRVERSHSRMPVSSSSMAMRSTPHRERVQPEKKRTWREPYASQVDRTETCVHDRFCCEEILLRREMPRDTHTCVPPCAHLCSCG